MKYKLVERDGWTFLVLGNGKDCSCPFASTTVGGEMYCGSWCPLFEIVERERLPGVYEEPIIHLDVHLHCGAGSRVIEVDRRET